MAETEKKASKKSWFKGLKAEFRKIIWVDNKTLGKQTVAVVAISAVTCGLCRNELLTKRLCSMRNS